MVLLPPEIWKASLQMQEAMQLSKKRPQRPRIIVSVAAPPETPTAVGFYVKDTVSKKRLLVDTGAMHSTFPPSKEDLSKPASTTFALEAANVSPIKNYGYKTMQINIFGKTYQ